MQTFGLASSKACSKRCHKANNVSAVEYMKAPLPHKAVAAAAAAVVLLSPLALEVFAPPPAHADYADRTEAMERRKALMQKAREDALSQSSEVQQEPEPPASAPTSEASPFSGFGSLEDTYKAIQQKSAPAPAASEADAPSAKSAGGFGGFTLPKFSDLAPESAAPPSQPSAPKAAVPSPSQPPAEQPSGGAWWEKLSDPNLFESPAPVAPAQATPALAPVAPKLVPSAPIKVEAKREQPSVAKSSKKAAPMNRAQEANNKRRGPLPLWFAEVLILGVYVGIGLAATKYNDQSKLALQTAGSAVTSLYSKVEDLLPKKQ